MATKNKMALSVLAPAALNTRIAVGSIDTTAIATGFLVVGQTSGGQEVTKPISKAEFKKRYADNYESKSQCEKAWYGSLKVFTQAAQADYNAKVTRGDRVQMVKVGETGRTTYTLVPQKENESNAAERNTLAKENAALKEALAKMRSQFDEMVAALKGLQAPAAK
jgi:hypothetical protein